MNNERFFAGWFLLHDDVILTAPLNNDQYFYLECIVIKVRLFINVRLFNHAFMTVNVKS